jgi:hypothetical protein
MLCQLHLYSVNALHKEVIHIPSERVRRCDSSSHNGMPFKTNELFRSEIFHLIFLDQS